MSYIYLQAQGGESSAECYSDIPAYVLSKSSRSVEKFSCNGNATEFSQNSRFGTTCELSTGDRGAEKSIAFAEASPAKTFPQREKERVSTEREADYGASSRVLLAKYDRNSRLWKTLQCSFLGDSDECLETFPKSGMMQNGLLWELTMSEPRTDANAFGYWRTPDTGVGGEISAEKAADFAAKKTRASGSAIQIRLCDQVRYPQLYPTLKYLTPKASDKGYAENQSTFVKRNGDRTMNCYASLSSQVLQMSGGDTTPQTKTARLNPFWVEWLMGWLIGWTDLKPLATDKFRSWRQQLLTF